MWLLIVCTGVSWCGSAGGGHFAMAAQMVTEAQCKSVLERAYTLNTTVTCVSPTGLVLHSQKK